jgi:hypothetical protein
LGEYFNGVAIDMNYVLMDVHVEPKPVDTACKGFACRKPFVVHIIS